MPRVYQYKVLRSNFFTYEEMDIMFIMWFLVKQGPGFIMYVCLMIRFFWRILKECKVCVGGCLKSSTPSLPCHRSWVTTCSF